MNNAISMIALGIALAASCGLADTANATDAMGTKLGGKTIPLSILDEQRGGADAHLSDIRAVGSVSDVKAFDLVTGNNVVTEGSLAGAAGMPMVIQNSGNGVLIQNAVILNVEVK